MTKPRLILLILLAFISCSGNTPHSGTQPGITIVTSLPRGGSYTASNGKEVGYRIFRIRVINDTIMPAELTINFSNDSVRLSPFESISYFGIEKSEDRYLKVFLFPQSMAPAKQEEVYNYGVTGIESFLDTGLGEPTKLKITIQPKQDYFFYIGVLLYPSSGRARSELFISGQNLVYRISIDPPLDSRLIPCGHIHLTPLQKK